MKEKNLSSINPGNDQSQDGLTAGQQKADETHDEQNHCSDDQQGNYTDEYDNYSPWG